MHAVGLGELRREIPGVVGKLGAEVKVIAPTLGTKLLNGRVDDRQTVRGRPGRLSATFSCVAGRTDCT